VSVANQSVINVIKRPRWIPPSYRCGEESEVRRKAKKKIEKRKLMMV
jgi:hypothetical protein